LHRQKTGEEYLRKSGLNYSIVRAGGLVTKIVKQEPQLLFGQGDVFKGKLRREDLALVCVEGMRVAQNLLSRVSAMDLKKNFIQLSNGRWPTKQLLK